MPIYPNSKTAAASTTAGTPKSASLVAAVHAWRVHFRRPKDYSAFCRLADAINHYLTERLPSGSLGTPLRGREPEIRQETLLLSIERYLRGNTDLVTATTSGSLAAISTEFERAVGGALSTIVLNFNKKIERSKEDPKEVEYFASIADPAAQKQKPHAPSFWDLSGDEQLELVYAKLEIASREKLLPRKTIAMLTMLLREGLTQTEIARRMGITPQAVCQRIRKAKPYLRNQIIKEEFFE